MALWGKLDQANNAVKYTPLAGSNATGNVMYGNTTPGAFNHFRNGEVGLFGVDQTEARVKGRGVTQGWVLVKAGMGPVTAVVATSGATFANGETVTLSNGAANGLLTLTTNATGNIASAVITNGGVFDANTNVVVGFNRQRKLANTGTFINYTGTATGYSNSDYVIVSNAVINATANVTTNSTGGSLTFTVNNVGLFSNTQTNTAVVIRVANSTGGNSAGTGATFTSANLVTSTGGTITISTLGGRAGRFQYETLAVVRSMANTTDGNDNTIFPNS